MEDGRRVVRLVGVAIVMLLLALFAQTALAQVRSGVPAAHQEFLSGGATLPDLSAFAPGPTSPTGVGRPPRVGPNTRVNAPQEGVTGGLFGRSETTVAATDDGKLLVAGWNDAQGFCGPPFGRECPAQTPPGLSGYGYSTDGGLTWTDGGAPDPVLFGHAFTRGDPWLDRGGFDGATFYYANLAVDATTGADLGVSIHRGHFAGGGFAWEDVRVINAPNAQKPCPVDGAPGTAPCDFYDKEALAAAKDGSGTAYISLTNFIEQCGFAQYGFGQIEVWRTADGGDTWQGPVIVSPDQTENTTPGDLACGFAGVLQQASVPALGPQGEVYVVWQFGPSLAATTAPGAEIRVARSLDGGVTFDSPVTVATINSMRQNPPVGYNRDRIIDHPRIAVATTGPYKGRVYVTYYSAVAPVVAGSITPCPTSVGEMCRPQTLTSSQVFLTFSDDQGLTWSPAVPVAPEPPHLGLKRWWPVVSVQPGGNVDVIYYQSQEVAPDANSVCSVRIGTLADNTPVFRRGPAHSLVDTYWAQSLNGGATFSTPVRVSTATSNWCSVTSNITPNFGDYIGSASGGNRVFPVWADGRNGVPDVFAAQILGAGKAP